jgi:hypothetical protein
LRRRPWRRSIDGVAVGNRQVTRCAGAGGGGHGELDQAEESRMTNYEPTCMYERYGGFGQTYPLTTEQQKYDDTCREIDRLQNVIGSKPMSAFTAAEFMWFSHFVNKMHFFPKQDQLDRQLGNLQALLTSLERRMK